MIVVLTMGRSGSSLLMQTLQGLGVDVEGQAFREQPNAQHLQGNPKGYYEDRDIMYGGPASETFQSLLSQPVCKVACKMELKHFASADNIPYWQNAAPKITTIFVSYRDPVEQARSEFLGYPEELRTSQFEFQFITSFLKQYSATFADVAERLESELACLKSKTHPVNYAHAVSNPSSYVRHIASTAELCPSDEQLSRTIENVEPGLHRVRNHKLSRKEQLWAQQLGAQHIYDTLDGQQDSEPWCRLRKTRS